jgi:hypothetical protein
MPYIEQEGRPKFDAVIAAMPKVRDTSDLEYIVYELCTKQLLECGSVSYTRANAIVGAICCASLEFCSRLHIGGAAYNRALKQVPVIVLEDAPRYAQAIKDMPLTDIPGDLNYVLTEICVRYFANHRSKPADTEKILDVLECAWRRFYGTHVVPYEATKRAENGDTPAYAVLLARSRGRHVGK